MIKCVFLHTSHSAIKLHRIAVAPIRSLPLFATAQYLKTSFQLAATTQRTKHNQTGWYNILAKSGIIAAELLYKKGLRKRGSDAQDI